MVIYIKCGEEYSDKRAELGYETCLKCGDRDALKETKMKSKCIAPAYNKGAYQYITSKDCVRNIYLNKSFSIAYGSEQYHIGCNYGH